MTENDNSKMGLKFWIAALAISVFLLAITFAALAVFLADIKNNTAAALARTDIVTERLNVLDAEVTAIHHHLVEEKATALGNAPVVVAPATLTTTPAADTSPAVAPTVSAPADMAPAPTPAPVAPLVKDVTPPSMKDAPPAIQAPVMTPSANNPPASK